MDKELGHAVCSSGIAGGQCIQVIYDHNPYTKYIQAGAAIAIVIAVGVGIIYLIKRKSKKKNK